MIDAEVLMGIEEGKLAHDGRVGIFVCLQNGGCIKVLTLLVSLSVCGDWRT